MITNEPTANGKTNILDMKCTRSIPELSLAEDTKLLKINLKK